MITIAFDEEYQDYYHDGQLIINLELFIRRALLLNKEIKFVKI